MFPCGPHSTLFTGLAISAISESQISVTPYESASPLNRARCILCGRTRRPAPTSTHSNPGERMRAPRFSALIAIPLIALPLSASGINGKATSASTSKTDTTQSSSKLKESKPPREKVIKGITKIIMDAEEFKPFNLSTGQYKKIGSCITDRVYGQATEFTLKSMASGKSDFVIAVKDQKTLETATIECAKQASDEIANSSQK